MYKEIPNLLSPAECQDLIKLCDHIENIPSPYVTNHRLNKENDTMEYERVFDERVHKATYYQIPIDHPINDKLWIIGSDFYLDNEPLHKDRYEFTHCTGSNILKYQDGGHFGWHVDGFNENDRFALSVQLSDPNDYEGGEVQFGEDKTGAVRSTGQDVYHDWELTQKSVTPVHTLLNSRGSCAVYDAFMYHRVTPTTKGTRYVLLSFFRNHPESKEIDIKWDGAITDTTTREGHNFPWSDEEK